MKVLAINGSPRKNGNTNAVLQRMGEEIRAAGLDFEILHVGSKNIRGCVACDACIFSDDHKCIMADEEFKGWVGKIEECDGLILACPTYFAKIPGTFKSFLDRVFCGHGYPARNKVGAAVVVLRRAGGTAAYSELMQYLVTGDMIIAPTQNWNIVHGAMKEESRLDREGLSGAIDTAKAMAWLIKAVAPALPQRPESSVWSETVTNFIRDDLK